MTSITIAMDFGSSLSRAIGSFSSEPELIFLNPQVVQVPQRSIENYERYKIGQSKPEDSAWLKFFGNYYAVGFLAKRYFYSEHSLQSLKVDTAIAQSLALIGSFAHRHELANFSLNLGVLLPWNELRDQEKYRLHLSQALTNFVFRGKTLSVSLESFTALPEGGGIFARGRVPLLNQIKQNNPRFHNIVVIMLGYRNASILVIEKGELSKGSTGNFGLARMIEKIQSFTSGQTPDLLVPVICQVGSKLGKRAIETLARSNQRELRKKEIAEISQAIADARVEYFSLLRNWLLQHISPESQIDELIISGGTALYLKSELMELFKSFSIINPLNWCETLEENVVHSFGDTVPNNCLEYRLADVYGLFCKMVNHPLLNLN